MRITSDVVALAISAITMLIALGQLLIMLPKAKPRKTTEKTSWSIKRSLEAGTMWVLFFVFTEGLYRYAFKVGEPTKWEIYRLVASACVGGVWYCLFLAKALLRQQAKRETDLLRRIADLEKAAHGARVNRS